MNRSTLFVPKSLLTVPNEVNSGATAPGTGVDAKCWSRPKLRPGQASLKTLSDH